MNIRWTIHVLIIVYGFMSCKSEKESFAFSDGKVIIAGIIENPDDKANVITLTSVGPVETNRLTQIVDSKGQFRFELNIIHPHVLMIKYEKGTAYVYTKNRDSLFIRLNSDAFVRENYPAYMIKGDHVETSSNIQNYHPYKNQLRFQPRIDGDLSVGDFLKKLKNGIEREDSVLSAFIKEYHPTRDFTTLERKDIIYRYANFLIQYKYFHIMNKTSYNGDLFDKNLFPVDDDSALVSSSYGLHLWHYSTIRYMQKDSVVKRLLEEKELLEANRICLDNICRYEKPGLSRDVMCFRILNALRESSYPDFLKLWENADIFIHDKTLISLMKEKIDLTKRLKIYGVSLLEPASKEEQEITGDFWEKLKEKHKGEVLFIDLWATYCGPCREEIPHAIKLQEYYKSKHIVFVNICMSSDKIAWKNAIDKQHIAGENYFLNIAQTQLLSNKLNLRGYPTYLIMDKNGCLVDKDAPRPSSGTEIKSILDKWVNNR